MSKSSLIVLFLVLLVSIVASSSIGYIVGSGPSRSFQSAIIGLNQTRTVTSTVSESSTLAFPGSIPIEPNPYEFSLNFEGNSALWYVPIVFLGQGSAVETYVNFNCNGPCQSTNASISHMGITSELPKAFLINQNGKLSTTSDITFTSARIVELENTSETILYTIMISSSSAGYYTLTIPFGCSIEPVLYVKVAGISYSPLENWLRTLKSANLSCSDNIEVTILGFTNSYFTEVPIQINSTS
jgi:hypothetical protein